MAMLTTQRGANSRVGNLPAIEHPGLRLPKGDPIEIHGSASRDGSIKSSLPPLRTENNPLIHIKTKKHSRGSTWPVDQENTDSKDGRNLFTLTQKKTVEELVELIDGKLTGSFYGIRQAFKGNDPKGKGVISREAFKNILYHLCGYVSAAQFSGLLQRFGLESRSVVAFDDFIRHFKNNEVVDKVWMDPVLRPSNPASNLPANRLKNLQRQRVAMKESNTRRHTVKMYTALQVFPMLKRKVRDNFMEFAKLLPTSCFDLDGTVLKPQLRHLLYILNVNMYDEEFDKVWDRFDRSGLGTVDSQTFFKVLGLRRLEMEPSDIPIDVIEPSHSPEITSPVKREEVYSKNEGNQRTPTSPTDDVQPESTPENVQEDILNILQGKFRSGYNSILQLCTALDTKKTGTISRSDFRHLLSKCRLNLGAVEVEHFLSRFGIRDQERIDYKEILNSLEDRTEKGILQRILDDKKHRFNRSRESDVGNTSAVDAEAKLLDIIHSDFLALLAAFKQLDRESLGVIKKYQFQEVLSARFGIQLTRKQTTDLLKKTGAEADDGLVLYGKFLEAFSPQSATTNESCENNVAPMTPPIDRPSTTPARSPRPASTRPATVQSIRPPTQVETRDVDQLLADIGELVTDKYDVIKKTFIGIDKISRNCGHLTRETFRKLFDRHNLKMTSSEVDNLWKKLPVERDGTLNFIELIKTCFNVAGKSPPTVEGDKPVGSLSRVLQNYARMHVKETLERFLEEEEEQHFDDIPMETTEDDKNTEQIKVTLTADQETTLKPGDIVLKIKNEIRNNFTQIQDDFKNVCQENRSTIDAVSFTNILLSHCKSLSNAECHKLCKRFERGDTGRVKYKEFLKTFVPTMPEGTDPIASRCHSRHSRSKTYPNLEDRSLASEALKAVMYKLRNKMIHEWKALRRAMKKHDYNDDGMISIDDFKSNLKEFGFHVSDEDFFHILSEFDVSMNGRISYVAFMKQAVL